MKKPTVEECEKVYVAYDLEVSGSDPSVESIIYIEAARFKNWRPVDAFQTFINPGKLLSPSTTEITGIRNYDIFKAENPNIKEALKIFSDFVGRAWLVGHNVKFDLNFLLPAVQAADTELLFNGFIDTLPLSRSLIPEVPNYKLSVLSDCLHLTSKSSSTKIGELFAATINGSRGRKRHPAVISNSHPFSIDGSFISFVKAWT